MKSLTDTKTLTSFLIAVLLLIGSQQQIKGMVRKLNAREIACSLMNKVRKEKTSCEFIDIVNEKENQNKLLVLWHHLACPQLEFPSILLKSPDHEKTVIGFPDGCISFQVPYNTSCFGKVIVTFKQKNSGNPLPVGAIWFKDSRNFIVDFDDESIVTYCATDKKSTHGERWKGLCDLGAYEVGQGVADGFNNDVKIWLEGVYKTTILIEKPNQDKELKFEKRLNDLEGSVLEDLVKKGYEIADFLGTVHEGNNKLWKDKNGDGVSRSDRFFLDRMKAAKIVMTQEVIRSRV